MLTFILGGAEVSFNSVVRFCHPPQKVQITNLNVLVVGTEQPWVEALCLEAGAASVTTLEYGAITSEHPQIKTVTPTEINEQFRRGGLNEFDIAVTYSSLEHSGLGRYGDAISPWGDVIWMAKLSCIVKKGGRIVVGVQSGDEDAVIFNAHRVYGPIRWPILLQNWMATDYVPGSRQVWDNAMVVAENRRGE